MRGTRKRNLFDLPMFMALDRKRRESHSPSAHKAIWAHGSAFVNRHEGSWSGPDIFGRRADEAVVGTLFHDVRRPTGRARDDEQRREHIGGNAAKMKRGRAVEIQIRKEFLLAPDDRLDVFEDGHQALVFVGGRKLFGQSLDDRRTRVVGFVNAMTETHYEF